MKPGIYPDLDFDTYKAIEACNNSTLSKMAISPADAKWAMENEGESSSAMDFGSAAHAATLEMDTFHDHYCVEPSLDGRMTQAGKASKQPRRSASFLAEKDAMEAEGFTTLKAEDFCKALNISDRIHQHDTAGPLLRRATGTEVSLVWEDHGVLCKARVDAMEKGAWLGDLKTTRDFPGFYPWVFTKMCVYRQSAWYLRGANILGLDCSQFFIIAVDNGPVTKVRCDRVDELALKAGEIEAGALFYNYRKCLAADEWPGDVPGLGVAEITDQRLNQLMPQERTD